MIKIAICESNIILYNITKEILKKINLLHNFAIIDTSFENMYYEEPDIIIINENFKCNEYSNGFEAANALRKNGCCADIIFLTSFPEIIYHTFDFSPSACIMKPIILDDMERAVLASISHIAPSGIIDIKINHNIVSINLDSIIYIEANGRCTTIRTEDKNYNCTENISIIEKRLPSLFFFRTHRTYILNFRHIRKTDKGIIQMKNGEYVILSRNRKNIFEAAYDTYKKKASIII